MKLALITIAILLLSECVYCQFYPGAEQISLSNSCTAKEKNVFSLFNNVACLQQINKSELGIYYSPSPFGLKELSNAFIAYADSFSFGRLAVGAMYYGFELYNEEKAVLGYANKIYDGLYIGIALNIHTVSIKNYGKDAAFYLNSGLTVNITDRLLWGFSLSNINKATFGSEKDQIPSVIKSGLSYNPMENLTFTCAFEKETYYTENISFGIEYDIIEILSLRSGFSSRIPNYSGGIGIHYSVFNLNYAFVYHSDLGFTHQTDLIILFE